MRVIDTSAWLELFTDSATIDALTPHWRPIEEQIVPTIVQLEVAKWMRRERSEEDMDRAIAHLLRGTSLDLTTRIALSSAELCAKHRLATADAIIYASVLDAGVDLLTCDKHFEGLAHVIYVPKAGS